ncbi:DM13 domain-containing protein [Parasphingopyxis sp. CP4]|uniref:DM13 domain-containing protein n=1 Tax=Parasphingopyxis sp. CP4 TaxID=2724527 RepID=UPI0015A1046B|nr:DM13 domain-containing protein [Parasphingopyxis sp. CP4]QLC22630.1 DM13 domain-containing protein [Parasphingopyxis sp. CP4]
MPLTRFAAHSAIAATALAAFAIPIPSTVTPAAAVAQTAGAQAIASGQFRGADRSHRANGSATIIRRANGDLVVQFEDFSVTGGPDLRVWVTDAADVRNARTARRANHVDLGRLRRSSGDQSYVIPAGALDGNHRSIVIWCRAFGVFFASAPLS